MQFFLIQAGVKQAGSDSASGKHCDNVDPIIPDRSADVCHKYRSHYPEAIDVRNSDITPSVTSSIDANTEAMSSVEELQRKGNPDIR